MSDTLWLRLRAPFAGYRWLQAGVYRATSPVPPPSAAWGLLLNLAHIETRDLAATRKQSALATLRRADPPPLQLAIGAVRASDKGVLYQQLHSYPVGASGKELAKGTHGAKYWIAPVRRELLVDLDVVVGARSLDPDLLARVVDGLAGSLDQPRYGLPFAGDNNCLFDRIDVLDRPHEATWYSPVDPDDTERRDSCRLTVSIDRAEASATRAPLFAPGPRAPEPPPEAWVWVPEPPAAATA
ncbi:CRISPR-associated protein Cas5 [Haliangium sp.]|uniref:CRISPR-associated protein Cas5 n=1 Tax=Haliangium sp. TaxID=2663208 RepID=UPI003D118BC6